MPRSEPKEFIVRVEGSALWTAAPDPETGVWVAVCQPLNLNAAGDTWWELQECINETMILLLTDLFESGEFEQFMRQNGFKWSRLPQRGERVRFDVPFTTRRATPRDLVAVS